MQVPRVSLRAISLALALALALPAGLQVQAQSKAPDAAQPAAKPALTVTVVPAQSQELPLALSANGLIAAWQESIIGAETSGLRLAEVRAQVGDMVKAGQVLATLSSESVEAEVAQARASVAEAEAARDEAAANAERARKLADTGALSRQQVDQLLIAARATEARLAAAQATLAAANIRLKNTRILAPDDGVISARAATVGSLAQPGQELFRLIRDNRLEWRAEVAAADLPRVKPGQKVSIALPGTAARASGRVRQVAPALDERTRNGVVFVDLVERAAARAGMYVKGDFELGAAGGLSVPQQSVVVRDGYSYVFAVGKDNRVARIKVTTGRRVADRVEITQGLTVGQAVVAAGAGFLNDGDLVAVVAAPAAAPAPATKAPAAPAAAAGKAPVAK